MKKLKDSLLLSLQLLKFCIISVPLACTLYFSVNIFYELKRIIYGK